MLVYLHRVGCRGAIATGRTRPRSVVSSRRVMTRGSMLGAVRFPFEYPAYPVIPRVSGCLHPCALVRVTASQGGGWKIINVAGICCVSTASQPPILCLDNVCVRKFWKLLERYRCDNVALLCGFSRNLIYELLLLLLIRFSAKNGRIGGMLMPPPVKDVFNSKFGSR